MHFYVDTLKSSTLDIKSGEMLKIRMQIEAPTGVLFEMYTHSMGISIPDPDWAEIWTLEPYKL